MCYTIYTVLRLPQNSLCHADFFHLGQAGGPLLRSFVTASISALVRSSLKTVPGWQRWIVQLKEAAIQFLHLRPLISETLTPSFWDSPPIAVNLCEASQGLPKHRVWSEHLPSIVQELKSGDLNRGSIQQFIYKKLTASKFVDCLNNTVQRRLSSMFHPFEVDFHGPVLLSRCWSTLKLCRTAEVIKTLKSWCNGWATSRRYHEDKILPCLFGCAHSEDDLSHYMQCPHLFALWRFLIDPRLDGDVSDFPLVRWGLIGPSTFKFRCIACVFSGYHAIRREFQDINTFFEYNQKVFTGQQLNLAWRVFADAFFVDARELAINTRKFSLPAFITFLDHGSVQFFHPSQST